MARQQDFATFAKNYKPIRFKFIGIAVTEYLPRQTIFDWPHVLRIRLKVALNLPITYFDLRTSLTSKGKKRADMAFLTHVIREHDRDAENVSKGEILRYHYTKLRYWPELSHINKTIGTPKTDNYILRWGYLLDSSPSFAELIHGTDGETAMYVLENLH